MEEAVLGLSGQLAPKKLAQPAWIPGTDAYTQIVGTKGQESLIRTTVPAMKVDTLLRLADIKAFNQTITSFPIVNWRSSTTGYFASKKQYFRLQEKNKKWVIESWTGPGEQNQVPDKAENITIDDNGLQIAYTVDNNLQLLTADGRTISVTNEQIPHVLNGQSVHRNEFGIDGGIFFSPKGNALAYYRMDETMVNDYPVIDWSSVPAANTNIKYPMSGDTSHEVTIGVYHITTGNTVFLKTGEPADQYLTCVTWSPDEKYIYVAILNRQQNHMQLNQYDAQTGNLVKTLFEESDEKYVEPQHALTFLPGRSDEFVWWSQRDGYMHLYRYNSEGKLLNQITKGNWIVNELLGHRADQKELIISGTKDGPMEKHLYKVQWETGKIQRLDQAPGIHQGRSNTKGTYLIDEYQNATTPYHATLLETKGKRPTAVLLQSEDKLKAYQLARLEAVTLKADDGTSLYGKLMYPANFDSSKHYPVIVYLYNGPHVQLVTNGYPASGNLWYDYLTQRGYFVFVMDGRGSSNRGLAFEQATFRHLGTVEMNDQLKGVNYLKSLPFIDGDRMGVHGWSFGGFMTTSLMLRHPDVFACGVAGGPVIDWRMYEIMYTERYMDTPDENPEGYQESNLLTKTGNLKGKLLMIHGTQDDVVVWQHSIKFLKACVDNGIQLDYFVYPGHPHNVRGKDRVHLMQKVTDYFDLYLK